MAQFDRWMLWAPVAFGGGAALYMGLKIEPPTWVAILALAVAGTAAWLVRRLDAVRGAVVAVSLAAFVLAGFGAAKLREIEAAAPISPVLNGALIEGFVVDVASPGAAGGRLVIAPARISGLPAWATPLRIRVTTAADALIGPGAAVRFRARLSPPPPPASPGGYDFARNAFFDGVGGVGYALSRPSIIDLPPPPWRLRLTLAINAARWSLTQRIVSLMGTHSGGLGAAMITGHEAWLEDQVQDDLRNAGLAHIVSISGVHMAIVGGFAFLLARTAMALWPWAALRAPPMKVAAAFGLVAVAVYLVVSGAPPPAERSAITASVAFGAILADRRAITLHALAVAALIILALQPEAVVEPGFQMSFAATAALVALAEAWPKRTAEIKAPWWIRLVQKSIFWLGVSLAASFVAGLATGPFAIQHFNRVALYGLPANLITEPLSSFVIMPALAVGAVLTPLGFGKPFLAIGGWGIDLMTAAAGLFAKAPHAILLVASAPAVALPVAFVGLLWMCLWKGRLRWLGLPFAFAVSLWPRPEPPLAWIAADGGAAAVRVGKTAILLRPEARAFASEQWTRRRGLTGQPAEARNTDFICSRQSCRAIGAISPRLSAWWTRRKPSSADLAGLCANADILILKAAVTPPAGCGSVLTLTQPMFDRGGSAEIYPAGGGGYSLVWAQDLRGRRPWTSPAGDPD